MTGNYMKLQITFVSYKYRVIVKITLNL